MVIPFPKKRDINDNFQPRAALLWRGLQNLLAWDPMSGDLELFNKSGVMPVPCLA